VSSLDPWLVVARRVCADAVSYRRAPLAGGVSASVEALLIERADGATRAVVVRRHPTCVMEHALLTALHAAGFEVPAPVLVEASPALLGGPFLVMERVEGHTDIAPDCLDAAVVEMASVLARLHSLSLDVALPAREDPIEGALTYLAEGAPARAALGSREARLVSANPPVVLHGDFWPGNILWRDGRIVAVIDWEDAARGDPLCDLAGARVELLWRYGAGAMEAFTEAYVERTAVDARDLPVWELFVASAGLAFMHQWSLDPETERVMRERGAWLIERATEGL